MNWKAVLVLAGLPFIAAAFLSAPPDTSGSPSDDPPVLISGETALVADTNHAVTVGTTNPAPVLPPTAATLPDLKLSGTAKEIVKLAQSGVDEPVMLTFITNSSTRFSLSPDQIIYLNDIGVSGPVITAMIEHDSGLGNVPAVSTPVVEPTQPATQMAETPVYPPETYVDYTTYNSGVTYVDNDVGYFYDSLAPYGSWVNVTGYGLCWQPTAYVRNHGWRPYNDRGRWLYSDCGWYWQSDYSWGWAAFHYGRWFCDERAGWVWHPNRVWGPAWVSWRNSADVCGWAPLPPAAHYRPGVGLTYGGHSVGANFTFGISANHFTFIPLERMCDYSPGRYGFTGTRAGRAFAETTVVNHFGEQNHRVFNRGIDPTRVETASHTPVRRAVVEEARRGGDRRDLAERIERRGNSLVIQHPALPTPPARRDGAFAGRGRGDAPNSGRDFGSPRTALNNPPAARGTQPVVGAPTTSTTPPTPTGERSRINVHVRGDATQTASTVAATTTATAPNTSTRNGRGNSIIMVGGRNVVEEPSAPTPRGSSENIARTGNSSGLLMPPRAGQPNPSPTTREISPIPARSAPTVGVTTSPLNPPGNGFHVTVREPTPIEPRVNYQLPNFGNRNGTTFSGSSSPSQAVASPATPATTTSTTSSPSVGRDFGRSRGSFSPTPGSRFSENNAVRTTPAPAPAPAPVSAPSQSQLMMPPPRSQSFQAPAATRQFEAPAAAPSRSSAPMMMPPSRSQPVSAPAPSSPPPSRSSSSSSSSSPPQSGRR